MDGGQRQDGGGGGLIFTVKVSLDGAVRHSSSTATLRKADKREPGRLLPCGILIILGGGSGACCGRKAKVEKWRCL